MIVREWYKTREDGVELWRTYSDAGMMIRQAQTGIEYSEAVDVADAPYTYAETETKIPEPDIDLASPEELRARLASMEAELAPRKE